MNIFDFKNKKDRGEKISVITCYDYSSARLLAQTEIDCLLVGDSVAMTMHGHPNTLNATIPMMCLHTEAVSRGANNKFIVTDLPFMSYRKSLSKSVAAAEAVIKAGAQAVKLEGAAGNLTLVRHLVESGIPVMGHLGLTLQSINTIGGFKVQGKTTESATRLFEEAQQLQEAGCFSLVLECIPSTLATQITKKLQIPLIGIGAGSATDGQVLVWQDMLGLNIDFKPKFVKTFMNGAELVQQSINQYIKAIHSGEFPSHEHCYGLESVAKHSPAVSE